MYAIFTGLSVTFYATLDYTIDFYIRGINCNILLQNILGSNEYGSYFPCQITKVGSYLITVVVIID